jgi:hypothetical protein
MFLSPYQSLRSLGRVTKVLSGVMYHSVRQLLCQDSKLMRPDGPQGLHFYLQNKTVTSNWKVKDALASQTATSMPVLN